MLNENFAQFWKQNVFNLVKQNLSLLLAQSASDSCKLMFIIRAIICSPAQLIAEILQNTLLHENLNVLLIFCSFSLSVCAMVL